LGNFLGVCGMHHIFWHLFGHVDPYTTGPFHPFLHFIQFLLLCTQCCVVSVGTKRQFMAIGKRLGLINFFYLLIIFLSVILFLIFLKDQVKWWIWLQICPTSQLGHHFKK
jgi:hypothetical protein